MIDTTKDNEESLIEEYGWNWDMACSLSSGVMYKVEAIRIREWGRECAKRDLELWESWNDK